MALRDLTNGLPHGSLPKVKIMHTVYGETWKDFEEKINKFIQHPYIEVVKINPFMSKGELYLFVLYYEYEEK